MRRYFIAMFSLIIFTSVYSQENFNLELLGNIDYDELLSDVWGYTSEDGTEYAIIGLLSGTAIISLEDPTNPQEVLFIPGAESIWRDIKTWKNYVYVVADRGTDGLLVINMSQAPENISYHFWRPEMTINNNLQEPLGRCHNLWIDEKGYAYLSGCRPQNNGGVLIFDLNQNIEFPPFIGAAAPIYSHDNIVKDNIMYSADILNGFFSVHDVSDKSSPVLLNTQNTSSNFTHNCWISDDGKHLFTTDERANAFVDAWDVSDPLNIQFLSSFRPITNKGEGVIPHNVHYFQGYLIVSWYTDGVIVIDAQKPNNLVKVGQYDTFVGPHGDFNGNWGAFPYLPSGLLLATDRQNGLFVFRPEYKRASYLEGKIVSCLDDNPIVNAKVEIISGIPNEAFTGPEGFFRTGTAFPGDYVIKITHPDYEEYITNADLLRGRVTTFDIRLIPKGSDEDCRPPLKADLDFRIFPNPASNKITLSFSQHIANHFGPFKISLHDASGRELLLSSWFSTFLELDISNYPSGVYFLELSNQKSSITIREKILVQN